MGLRAPTNPLEIERTFLVADGALARKDMKILRANANALHAIQALTDEQRRKLTSYFLALSEDLQRKKSTSVYKQPPPRYTGPRRRQAATADEPTEETTDDANMPESPLAKRKASTRIATILSSLQSSSASYAEAIMDMIPSMANAAREDGLSHDDVKFMLVSFCVRKKIEDMKRAMILDALAASMG